ncbi:hypothetical protein BC835DRAFT_1277038 [Cytidiella melzeri]|nr:hypothetical protein BC835DRAFT_1277038 [Cytidiella melzeri]
MFNTRSPSPRVPPPAHPSLRRQSEVSSPQSLGETPSPSFHSLTSGPPPVSTQPISSATSSGSYTPSVPPPAAVAGVDGKESLALDEEEMSEAQLRQLYEEEEIDRFLQLFANYIREVKVPQIQELTGKTSLLDATAALGMDAESDEEGMSPASTHEGTPKGSPPRPETTAMGTAEWVASQLMPFLPPAPPSPPFTVRGVRLLTHRALVIVFHTYIPTLSKTVRLATWTDPKVSLKYCILYWFLWFHDLLLAGLIARVAYSLLRRKYLPYPNLEELRQRRKEEDRADDVAKQIITRLAISPVEHVTDLWQTFKEYRSSRKKEKPEAAMSEPPPEIVVEDTTVTEDTKLPSEDDILVDNNMYGPIFEIATRIADVHERMRNLFLWRRPHVSMMFAFVLLGMFFVSLLPSKYLCKLVGLSVGVLFWHVIPVIAAMPGRLPAPLEFVPTDAEYAMDLISQRVALGLPVQPKPKQRGKSSASYSGSFLKHNGGDHLDLGHSQDAGDAGNPSNDVDWDKWKGRLDGAKAWSGDVKDSFKDGTWKDPRNWLATAKATPNAQKETIPTHTYPAQCKVPGLITLTDSQLFFTPITSIGPTMTVNLKNLTGAKRSGLAKGLKLSWTDVQEDGETTEQEERFLWVGGRDDLFARLVGNQSKQWLHL